MTQEYILRLSDSQADLALVGGKGASLARLANAGLPVPDGFHATTTAYKQFVAENNLQPRILDALKGTDTAQPSTLEAASHAIHDLFRQAEMPREIAEAIATAYAALPSPGGRGDGGEGAVVAVRSSATAEDLPDLSFAGQQDTFLNIRGTEAVLEAVKKCWASLWTARAIGYRLQHRIDQNSISLAVVVQLLVPADASGILFTANPVNGQRDQAMITTTWGLGEAIVGGLVTPDSLTVEKATGRVISRETADKQVMTVRIEGGTEEQPVPEAMRRAPVLSDSEAGELVKFGGQIEKLYGMPMDIEWTLAEERFAIVQARPITALPEPPIEWIPPNPKGIYMRTGVVDLMPDPLSSLYITWGIPVLKAQMKPLGVRLMIAEPVLQEDYYTSINGYAYMNAAFPPKAWWWIITGLLPGYPRLLRKLIPIWRDELHPEYKDLVSRYREKIPATMSTSELWRDAQDILNAAMFYVGGLLFATMGASAGSEGLLTQVYNKMVKQEGDPDATTLLMGWDNIPVRSEKSLFDLATWCRERAALAGYILTTPSDKLAEQLKIGQAPAKVDVGDWTELQTRFNRHLEQFGHIVFQLDFAEPLPLDNPAPMLENIKMYLRGEGTNPYERQKAGEEKRIRTAETMRNRLKGFKHWAFVKALNWGQSMAEVREDALAEIGLGYPTLRAMLRELGSRFVQAGVIAQAEDIFWLEKDEVTECIFDLEQSQELDSLSAHVERRKAFWKKAKQETPPPMMPMKKKYMGINTDVWLAESESNRTGNTLKGVATSAGKVTAAACVLHGPEDFNQMRPGAVLVAGTTTPAWTPLFAMASAVVTDIGGPLSHGSIVAREYGIPAVMGTGVATRRIHSGQMITVDGSAGTVELK